VQPDSVGWKQPGDLCASYGPRVQAARIDPKVVPHDHPAWSQDPVDLGGGTAPRIRVKNRAEGSRLKNDIKPRICPGQRRRIAIDNFDPGMDSAGNSCSLGQCFDPVEILGGSTPSHQSQEVPPPSATHVQDFQALQSCKTNLTKQASGNSVSLVDAEQVGLVQRAIPRCYCGRLAIGISPGEIIEFSWFNLNPRI
jgi:hypothetical protein